MLDGVYVKRGEGLAFFASPAPTREALQVLVTRVVLRVMKWLKRKHYVREDIDSNEEAVLTPLEASTRLAMQRGTLETMRDSEQDEDDETAPKMLGDVVAHLGFNLHASVTIAAQDDQGRERLCRYGARPPFSLARLRVLKNGNVSYLVKKVGRGRAKHRARGDLRPSFERHAHARHGASTRSLWPDPCDAERRGRDRGSECLVAGPLGTTARGGLRGVQDEKTRRPS